MAPNSALCGVLPATLVRLFVACTGTSTGRMGRVMSRAQRAFNAVKLIFELAGEGWSFSRIAAELNGMESRSEPSE